MKIAVPTKNNQVDNHFGHCEYYTLFSVNEKNEIIKEEILPSLPGCGCKSNIIPKLKDTGVEIMLAGNMGQGAVNKITVAGIKVFRGCSGDVRKLAEAFLKEEIQDSGETCQHHHGNEHQCNH